MKNTIFWDVTQCYVAEIHWHFGGTSVNSYQSTWFQITEDTVKPTFKVSQFNILSFKIQFPWSKVNNFSVKLPLFKSLQSSVLNFTTQKRNLEWGFYYSILQGSDWWQHMPWSGYSFLHAKFRIWTKRLNLCLNLRPQLVHAWRGSWPHSTLMCRRNEWYSWYILQHLGHTNKLLSCCVVVSVLCALSFWCLLDKMEVKTPAPRLYSPSSSTETVKKKLLVQYWVVSLITFLRCQIS